MDGAGANAAMVAGWERGVLVGVVGPSGAGKDTLIAGARKLLVDDPRFTFPRRIVTRPSSDAEDHDTLSVEAFRAAQAQGGFALSWHAHGLHYGIPASAFEELASGMVAVCNLSRGALPAARQRFQRVTTVLVTAPREVLEARLASRQREGGEDIQARLARQASADVACDHEVFNVGAIEETVARFAALLRSIAAA